jgi:hypothetical protein
MMMVLIYIRNHISLARAYSYIALDMEILEETFFLFYYYYNFHIRSSCRFIVFNGFSSVIEMVFYAV